MLKIAIYLVPVYDVKSVCIAPGTIESQEKRRRLERRMGVVLSTPRSSEVNGDAHKHHLSVFDIVAGGVAAVGFETSVERGNSPRGSKHLMLHAVACAICCCQGTVAACETSLATYRRTEVSAARHPSFESCC
jgi:hypothetical protein